MISFLSTSVEETRDFGRLLAIKLRAGDILCLFGDLGSGKTTFVKGLAEGLRIDPRTISSPTFVLMKIYEGCLPLYDFDLYRLEEDAQIAAIGCDEFLYGEGVSVIEWSERFGKLLPDECLEIRLAVKTETERAFRIKARGKRYQELLTKIKGLI